MCPSIIDKLAQEVASLALAQFKESGVRNIRIYTLQIAVISGNLDIIKSVKELFAITPEEIRSINLFDCGSRPSKELVQGWIETCEPSKADLVNLFELICLRGGGGMADTARNLATQFNFTKDDLLSVNDSNTPYALLAACRRGDLELTKWIIETYDFTLDDIKKCNLLLNSYNPELLQYLISTFSFDREYAIKAFYYYACTIGDLALVKTLANFYEYTLSEVREKNKALITCTNSAVREWLLDTYYKDITTN